MPQPQEGFRCCPSTPPHEEVSARFDVGFADSGFDTQVATLHQQLNRLIDGQDSLFNGQARLEKGIISIGMTLASGMGKDGQESFRPFAQVLQKSSTVIGKRDGTGAAKLADSQDTFGLRDGTCSKTSADSATEKAEHRIEMKRKHIQHIFEVNHEVEKKETKLQRKRAKMKHEGIFGYLLTMPPDKIEVMIDSIMSIVIFANSVFIGLSMDANDGGVTDRIDGWIIADITFTIIFLLELCVKLKLHGFCGHFCGNDKCSNIFDTALIVCDAVQLAFEVFLHEVADTLYTSGVPSASLFRIVRLVRLARLLRLFKHDTFRDLMSMLQGLLNGALTLVWAVVVFVLTVYVFALICRESFGREQEVELVYPYFSTVDRSMLTVFRCSFGDCSTDGGVPIPEHITAHYGGGYALGYCVFVFCITIGLFNIISAIFVDSTMSASANNEAKSRQQRLEDDKRWSRMVARIIKELIAATPEFTELMAQDIENEIDSILEVEFSRSTIDKVIRGDDDRGHRVRAYLNSLDIDAHDHKRLPDILDPDHSGTIGVMELVEGLQRLRGDPRRSDVVTVDLMVRSLQEKVDLVLDYVSEARELRERNQYLI